MKKQDYRCAVGSIHWSYEKRRSIEERLAQPVRGKTEQDIERILKQKPARKTARKKSQYKPYQRQQEDIMKKQRKQHRAYLLILAAAMLAIGGTAAAIAYSSKKSRSDLPIEESSKSQQDLENSITEEELANAVISPKLTDQQDMPDCHSYAETDSGFFYLDQIYKSPEQGREPVNYAALKYCDTASGESVFVCARPNCLHDRNEFCTATTKNYEILSQPVWLDGYVYLIALDNRELLANPERCTTFPTVLLRYAPDGTEITEVAQLHLSDHQYLAYVELIAHRGQLWISCAYIEYWNTYDSNMEITSQESKGTWEMYCYEPEAKKLTTLCTSGEPQTSYRPYSFSINDTPAGGAMKGIGDFVYFQKISEDWRDPIKGAGIYHIDCRTGRIKQDVKIKSEKSILYTISSNQLFYTFDKNVNSNHNVTADTVIKVYDLNTGTETELVSVFALAKEQMPDLEADMLLNSYRTTVNSWIYNLIADKDRLYLFWNLQDFRENFEAESISYITELNSNGNARTVQFTGGSAMKLTEEFIRRRVAKFGYWYQEKTWVSAGDVTEDIMMFIRSNGFYETEDGEWIDPRKLKNEDWERAEASGFYYDMWISYTPEEVTEAVYQKALEQYEDDSFAGASSFNGKDFYLNGNYGLYRMTPEAAMNQDDAERIMFWDLE